MTALVLVRILIAGRIFWVVRALTRS